MTTCRSLRRLAALPLLASSVLFSAMDDAEAQPAGFNYDESKVPAYTLPDALTCLDGTKVADAKTWQTKRRPELLNIFAEHVYGRTPKGDVTIREEWVQHEPALNGLATRKQVRLSFERNGVKRHVDVLAYLPAKTKGPSPAFIGLNFQGNHTVHADPGIILPTSWMPNDPKLGVTNNVASELARGNQ